MSVATNHFFATVTDPLFDYLDWSSCDFMQSKQSGGTLIIGSVWKCGKGLSSVERGIGYSEGGLPSSESPRSTI